MIIDLSGKRAIVTGSTEGIGYAHAWWSMAARVTVNAVLVVYACSPQASATTGAALRVEGGIVETIA